MAAQSVGKQLKVGLIGGAVMVGLFAVPSLWNQHQERRRAAERAAEQEKQRVIEQQQLKAAQEAARLRETPEYYYRGGVDLQNSGDFADAKTAFQTVITKFPDSNLVDEAKQRLADVDIAIAKQQQEREAANAARGEDTTFLALYSQEQQRHTIPYPGKRYRFRACVTHSLSIWSSSYTMGCSGDSLSTAAVPEFDNQGEYESFLSKPERMSTVVASSGWDGKIHVHRIE